METPPPVRLREIVPSDLEAFFLHQLDPEANRMAAFTSRDPTDREAFMEHWRKILADETIVKRAILSGEQVVGNIACFLYQGRYEVGYWIDPAFWGRGIATQALRLFLGEVTRRPLYASAARDNAASLRVLEKCGFAVTGYEKSYAGARGEEIEEVHLVLE